MRAARSRERGGGGPSNGVATKKLQEELKAMHRELDAQWAARSEAEEKAESLSAAITKSAAHAASVEAELKRTKKELSKLQKHADKLQADVDTFERKEKELQDSLKTALAAEKSLSKELEVVRKAHDEDLKLLDIAERSRQAVDATIKYLKGENSRMKAQLAELQAKEEAVRKEAAQAKEALENAQLQAHPDSKSALTAQASYLALIKKQAKGSANGTNGGGRAGEGRNSPLYASNSRTQLISSSTSKAADAASKGALRAGDSKEAVLRSPYKPPSPPNKPARTTSAQGAEIAGARADIEDSARRRADVVHRLEHQRHQLKQPAPIARFSVRGETDRPASGRSSLVGMSTLGIGSKAVS
ncbi:unnamed protein product [Pedinophyceae sp. YPF-701]|nr:unnamed protein product [Pedinophyceae sp. YPF-701]